MPIPAPPGALPEAHRVVCLRCVRAFGRGKTVDYKFSKLSSKKCGYCTSQNEKCNPIPEYVRSEWRAFRVALRAWETDHDDEDTEPLRTALDEAARVLSAVVQTTQASVAGMIVPELLVVQGRALDRLALGMDRLERAIADMHDTLKGVGSCSVGGRGKGKGKAPAELAGVVPEASGSEEDEGDD